MNQGLLLGLGTGFCLTCTLTLLLEGLEILDAYTDARFEGTPGDGQVLASITDHHDLSFEGDRDVVEAGLEAPDGGVCDAVDGSCSFDDARTGGDEVAVRVQGNANRDGRPDDMG